MTDNYTVWLERKKTGWFSVAPYYINIEASSIKVTERYLQLFGEDGELLSHFQPGEWRWVTRGRLKPNKEQP